MAVELMRVSAHFSLWGGLVFTLFATAYAVYGLVSITPDMSAVDQADAHGFALFWFFMGGIGAVMAAVSWLMLRGKLGPIDE
jgi:hypothetical protein